MGFFSGSPAKIKKVFNRGKEQEPLYQQLVKSGLEEGAGGAFGTAADYYRSLLSENPEDYRRFAAPMMRQFGEEIMPGISEQFAGMGAGGLSSSGFKNAAVQGATDLAERLGALRSSLRQAGAAGLQNIGQLGLQSFHTSYEVPGQEGFLSKLAPAAGAAIGTAFGGPIGGAIGSGFGNWISGVGGKSTSVGANTSPYGGQMKSSANVYQKQPLPGFMQGYGGYRG